MSKKNKRLKIAIISICIIIVLCLVSFLIFNFTNKDTNNKESKKENNIEIKEEISEEQIIEDEEKEYTQEKQEELIELEEIKEDKKEEIKENKKENSSNSQSSSKKENNSNSSSNKNNTTTNTNTNKETNTNEKVDTNTTTNKDSEKEENKVSNNDDTIWNEFLKSNYVISVLETSTPDFYTREEQHKEFELWFNLGYRVEEPVVCLDLSSGKRCAYSLLVYLPKGVCGETDEIKINWRNKNYIGIVAYAKSIGYKCEGYQD